MSKRFLIWRRWIFLSALVGGVHCFSAPVPAHSESNGLSISASDLAENIATRKSWAEWNAPFKPFHIIGNVYYVGPTGVSSFLITTPEGNILIDTGFESSVDGICESITKLGFKWQDIKIILNSHAHMDHCGGDAKMKSLTGAKIMLGAPDADLLASGGARDFTPYSLEMKSFPPAHADRQMHDGGQVKLGGAVLNCHLTPGHTKGCVTWTMDTIDAGKTYHVVFYGSTSLLSGIKLLNNPQYPNIVADYTASFKKLEALPCDVFLGAHGIFFDLTAKAARLEKGETPNPFIDPAGYHECLRKSGEKFQAALAREQPAKP